MRHFLQMDKIVSVIGLELLVLGEIIFDLCNVTVSNLGRRFIVIVVHFEIWLCSVYTHKLYLILLLIE